MDGGERSWEFWIAVCVALVVKVRTTKQLTPIKVLTSVVVAVGAAWVATDFAVERTGMPEPLVAGVITLLAEGVLRWLLIAVDDPRRAIDLWKYFRE